MTIVRAMLLCDVCERSYDVDVTAVVEATDALLVERLLRDTLNRSNCTACGAAPARPVAPVFYVDRAREYAALVYTDVAIPRAYRQLTSQLPEALRQMEPIPNGSALSMRLPEVARIHRSKMLFAAIAGAATGGERLLQENADLVDESLPGVLATVASRGADGVFLMRSVVATLLRYIGLLDDPEPCSPRDRMIIVRCAHLIARRHDELAGTPSLAQFLTFVERLTDKLVLGDELAVLFAVCEVCAAMPVIDHINDEGCAFVRDYAIAACRGAFGKAMSRLGERDFEASGYTIAALKAFEKIAAENPSSPHIPAIERQIIRLANQLYKIESSSGPGFVRASR